MQQIQQQINLYHTLFYVCLGICIFFFVLSLFFFVRFDIRNIFNERTGRSVKRSVQQMEEINSRTGQLRRPVGSGNTGGLGRTGGLTGGRKRTSVRKEKMEDLVVPPTTPTEPLTGSFAESVNATEVLRYEQREEITPEKAQEEVDESFGMFRIEKYMLVIHTDEVV